MLTKKQQLFIVKLLWKKCMRKDIPFYSPSAFYRMAAMLKENNLVRSRQKEDNRKIMHVYELTFKGEILARILASLLDNDDKTKNIHGWDVQ